MRHRAPRFLNRTKPEGWLAPSLRHRLDTTLSWVARLQRLAPPVTNAKAISRLRSSSRTTRRCCAASRHRLRCHSEMPLL
ncbi:RRXRR domain-containing protein [Rhabdochromatium marinum]|uniref:RRXRR domain-containing protein n=1 Tax=Rhabdochromatium marinum TaxID=48729 RepID=UPI003B82C728